MCDSDHTEVDAKAQKNHQHFNILNLYRGKITVLEKICRPVATFNVFYRVIKELIGITMKRK